MVGLTTPSNSHDAIKKAKKERPNYNSLIGDLEGRGLSVTYRTLEIGSHGHYLPDAIHCISHTFQLTRTESKKMLEKASNVVIVCSYQIFNCRNSVIWDTNKLLYSIYHVYPHVHVNKLFTFAYPPTQWGQVAT